MTYSYPGPFTPYDHQRKTTEFVVNNKRCFVLNEMGLGKSASVLWAIDWLMQRGEVTRALIIAPLPTLHRVWQDEAFRLLMHRQVTVLHSPSSARRRKLYDGNWEVGVINPDGIKILSDRISQDEKLNMVVVDEVTEYRNTQTKRFKGLKNLLAPQPRICLMSGAPTPEAPTDAFALGKLIGNPHTPKFFGAFRRQTMFQVAEFKWVPKADGYRKAFTLLQPAVRFKKSECMDLPPVVWESLTAPLSPHQRHAYKAMQGKMRMEFADSGGDLPAANAADKINKLRQIACGVIRDTTTGEYLAIDHKSRLSLTLSVIQESAAKAIVVVPFKGIINELKDEISPHYSVDVMNGDVSIKQRNIIVQQFMEQPDPHVLLVHPKVMSHGLTLTAASLMVFYAPIHSNDQHGQIIERINRPGQKNKMTIVRIYSTELERSIYQHVDQKAIGESDLLSMYDAASKEAI